MGYLVCQDNLESQARKGNLATSTSKEFQGNLEIKVCLVHLEPQASKESQVFMEHQDIQDRKEKEVTCHSLECQGPQGRKVKRVSKVSQGAQVEACLVDQVHREIPVFQE